MTEYEYQVIQMAAGGRTVHLNERMENMAAEGWEPVMMSGDTAVNIMMRRPRGQVSEQQVAQAAAAVSVGQ